MSTAPVAQLPPPIAAVHNHVLYMPSLRYRVPKMIVNVIKQTSGHQLRAVEQPLQNFFSRSSVAAATTLPHVVSAQEHLSA